MNIVKKSKMFDNTQIQIENWHKDYSFYAENGTVTAYPIAKETGEKPFAPERGKIFRLSMSFNNSKQAEKAFTELENGTKTLKDFIEYFDRKDYIRYL